MSCRAIRHADRARASLASGRRLGRSSIRAARRSCRRPDLGTACRHRLVVAASLATSLAKNHHPKWSAGARRATHLLTGAAFTTRPLLPHSKPSSDKRFVVAEHKEVSGAIGAALLAGEQHGNAPSAFRGFSAVASAAYALRSFTCQHCENNCAISVMTDDAGRRFYYGSRCDRYDAASEDGVASRPETAFAERERLSMRAWRADKRPDDPDRSAACSDDP